MYKQPLWARKHKDDVKDQITITGRQSGRSTLSPGGMDPMPPIAPPSYSTGDGDPTETAMVDLTEFHKGEEVVPNETVKMAGGHENVRNAVAQEVDKESYRNGAVVHSYYSGGAVGREPPKPSVYNPINKKTWDTEAKTAPVVNLDNKPQTTTSTFKAPNPLSVTPDSAVKSVNSGPINTSRESAKGYETASIASKQASESAMAGAKAGAAAGTIASQGAGAAAAKAAKFAANKEFNTTPAAPIKKLETPEFQKTDLKSDITVDPTIKVDPKYKRNIDSAISDTKAIARGESEVSKTISNRALQDFDTRAQTQLAQTKLQIANNPNMTDSQKKTAMASAMRDINSGRSGLTGDLAESNMNRAENAIGKVASMSGSQQAYEAANQKFEIDRETANQIFEKNFDYTQELSNNVHEYAASKDRFDFEYKTTVEQANAAIQAGDYGAANKAYGNLGFDIDFSKVVDSENRRIEGEKLDLDIKGLDLEGAKQAIEKGDLDIESLKQAIEKGVLDIKGAEQALEAGELNIESIKQSLEKGDLSIKALNQAIEEGEINLNTAKERSELEMEALRAEAERAAETKIGDSMSNLTTSIVSGMEFENELVQHDLARAYEAMNGEGSAQGPEFEAWGKENYDSIKVKTHPIYGPISSLGDEFIDDLLTGIMKTENTPDWNMEDFKYGTATGVEAGKQAMAALMVTGGLDPVTMERDADNPIWDVVGLGPGSRAASGGSEVAKPTFDIKTDDPMGFGAEDTIKAGREGNEESYDNAVRANVDAMGKSKDYSDLEKYNKSDPYYEAVKATATPLNLETKYEDRSKIASGIIKGVDHYKFTNPPEVGSLITYNGNMYQVSDKIYADRKKGRVDTQTIPVIDPQTGKEYKIGISRKNGKVGMDGDEPTPELGAAGAKKIVDSAVNRIKSKAKG